MKHLRKNGIEIYGSTNKKQLRNLGYYHLYKGYRFYRKSDNRFHSIILKKLGELMNMMQT